MTTIIPFTPSNSSQFTFQPTLDGSVYNATCPWSLFGVRYYLNLFALDGTQVVLTAIAGSPTGTAIASLTWAAGTAFATTSVPHGYRIASAVNLAVSGCIPDGYNGFFKTLITGPRSFSYPLGINPGTATILGAASYNNINLVGGVKKPDGTFFSSSLIFRVPANQFEISP